MPRIGFRNIKTAIAVLICLLTNVLLVAFLGREEAFNWYTPFFAGIAACYSLQSDTLKSLKQAKIRSVGSIIGGIFGMGVLLLFETFIAPWATEVGGNALALLIQYGLVAIGIIFVIHITVITKQTDATFITCLTYLSVTVSIRNGGLPVVIFAVNRILSTLYGVLIAIIVNILNVLSIPIIRRKDIMFICGYENCLEEKNKINGFKKYTINRLLFLGANVTASTSETPATLNPLVDSLKIKLPVVVMNGAALFDFKSQTYSNIVTIPKAYSRLIERIIKENGCNYFATTVVDDVEHIFIHKLKNDAEKNYYQKIKNAPYTNFDRDQVPNDIDVIYYIILNKTEVIDKLMDVLKDFDVLCVKKQSQQYHDCSFLNIYSKKVLECNYLKEHEAFKDKLIYVIGNSTCEEIIMTKADYSLCNYNATANLIRFAKEFTNTKDNDKLIKRIKKLYHQKKR